MSAQVVVNVTQLRGVKGGQVTYPSLMSLEDNHDNEVLGSTFAVVFQLRAGNSSGPPFQFASVNVTVSAKTDDSEAALPLSVPTRHPLTATPAAEAANAGAAAGADASCGAAFFALHVSDLEGAQWPRAFERYSLFVASLGFTAAQLRKVKEDIPGARPAPTPRHDIVAIMVQTRSCLWHDVAGTFIFLVRFPMSLAGQGAGVHGLAVGVRGRRGRLFARGWPRPHALWLHQVLPAALGGARPA